jgi:hypothetical protein
MSTSSTLLPESRKRSAESPAPATQAKRACVVHDMDKIDSTKEYSIASLAMLTPGGLGYLQNLGQNKWVDVIECDRATAIQHNGGAFLGEDGSYYFYFAPCNAEAFTAKQLECLVSSIDCCFCRGHCCEHCCDEDDEDDEDPCECKLNDHSFMMKLNEETFDDECQAGLLPIKWKVQGECCNENMYSMEQLRFEIGDLNNLSPKLLMTVATYLQNPVGHLNLPYKVIISVA